MKNIELPTLSPYKYLLILMEVLVSKIQINARAHGEHPSSFNYEEVEEMFG